MLTDMWCSSAYSSRRPDSYNLSDYQELTRFKALYWQLIVQFIVINTQVCFILLNEYICCHIMSRKSLF